MNLDVDFLIDFYKKHTSGGKGEIGEAETAPVPAAAPATSPAPSSVSSSGGDTSTGSGKPVKKWETGLNRGKANPVANTKWETGLSRGKANQIGNTKWSSGRGMGKTGGSDFA